jgi:uncharacterized protein
MKINVHNLPHEGLVVDFVEKPEAFPVLMEMARSGECLVSGPVSVHLQVQQIQELISASGRLSASIKLDCSRCLKTFESPLNTPLKLIYSRQPFEPDEAADSDRHETELSIEQMGLIYFQGDEIDLNPALQEQIVMALPIKPLCRQDCKGLCPHCGIDRNASRCNCHRQSMASPFAKLKDFLPKR